jgi:hypothetical protein
VPVANAECGSRTRFWTMLADIHHTIFPIEIFRPRSILPGSHRASSINFQKSGCAMEPTCLGHAARTHPDGANPSGD